MNKLIRLLRYDWPLHFVLLFTNWLPDNTPFLLMRGWLAHNFFSTCGKGLKLGRNLTFYNPSKIKLGGNIYIANGCWFMAGEIIKVEDNVLFGPYCCIVSSNHLLDTIGKEFSKTIRSPITIGNGCWIASHVVVTAGCTIGQNTLVGAGAIVTSDIPSHVVAIGIPAKVSEKVNES